MPTPEGPKQQDSTDIKDISNKMENITKDGKVDEKEITELNKATDFLDKNKDNKEIEKEFSKINDKINKSKPEITTGIINQLKDIALPIVLGKDQTFKRTEILTKESTQAYLNIIKRLNTGKNEKKNQDETTSKTENTKEHTQDIALNAISIKLEKHLSDLIKNEQEIKEKTGEDKLKDILKATPTKENAGMLFGEKGEERKGAREALFNGNTITKNSELSTSNKEEDKVLIKLIATYGDKKNVEDICSCKVITADKNNQNYNEGTKYIQVEFNGKSEPQDIMFGKTTDVIHTARADKFNANTYETKDKKAQDIIKDLDEKGSYRSFEKLIKAGKINLTQALANKDLWETISKQETKDTDKKNGYFNIITDYVVSETQKNMSNMDLLQSYLKNVNKNNLQYLGTDRTAQIANYNKLVNIIKDPKFDKTKLVNKEIWKNIADLQTQLQPASPKNIQEALKQGAEKFRDQYGENIVSILEFFGGKGFAKKLLGKYYDQYKDKINEKYEKKYSLNKDQITAVQNITKNLNDTQFNPKNTPLNASDLKKQFNKESNFSKSLMSKEFDTKLMDPKIVNKVIESHNKKGEDKKTVSDYLVINDKNSYEVKDLSEAQKKDIIDMVIEDESTRTNISNADRKIRGAVTNKKTGELTRSDLNDGDEPNTNSSERTKYAIKSPKDLGIAFTSYLFAGSKELDYVITETKGLKEESGVAEETKIKELKFKDEKTISNSIVTKDGDRKQVQDLIDMKNAPDTLLITPKSGTAIKVTRSGDTYIFGGETVTVSEGTKIEIVKAEKTETKPEVKK